MNILHINTFQEGGAAWCARRINHALVQQGVNSKMLFAEGEIMPEGVEGAIAKKDRLISFFYSNKWLARAYKFSLICLPFYKSPEKLQFKIRLLNTQYLYLHQPLSNYKNIAHHPLVKWADIIHLHWVPDFVDYPTFFKQVEKPIVWTLHDKYPAVGIQHYCSIYFPLPENLKDINRECIKIKQNGVIKSKNLHIVAISELMQEICKKSEILNCFPCTLIHNGVDTNTFKPYNVNKKEVLSKYLDNIEFILPSTKFFMFSSYGIWDEQKGLNRIIDALEKINYKDKALIVVGNNFEKKIPKASFPIYCTGLIKDQQELAKIYSVSDYFILASYEETFAQTPLEAMSCGIPVVSTPCSGIYDLIRTFNGIMCKGYGSDDIAEGINKALSTVYNSKKIRQHILDHYDYEKIAKKYIDLYNKVLQE